jgi:hypothetical protein
MSTMALHATEKEENKTKPALIRDFSINTWNESPGLKRWDYDDDDPEK